MARRTRPHHCVHCHQPIIRTDGVWKHDKPNGQEGQWRWCESRKDLKITPAPPDNYRCQHCSRVYPYPIRVHSGYRECGKCWDWRKLHGPQTDYWTVALEGIFVQDGKPHPALGSGPDANDMELWHRWGIMDEVMEALHTLNALLDRYEILDNASREVREAILYPESARVSPDSARAS